MRQFFQNVDLSTRNPGDPPSLATAGVGMSVGATELPPVTNDPSLPEHEDMAPARPIGRAAGLLQIGIHLVTVPPGRRTSYPHAESAEEEFV